MLDFTENRLDFVSNINVNQLREISSVKKTCIFKIKTTELECYAVFKFGKLVNLYCSPLDIKILVINGLNQENFISKEVSFCLINSEINLPQVFDCLHAERLMSNELLEILRQNFYLEFIQQLLFDRNSEFFHVGQADFVERLKTLDFECVLEQAELEEQFIGHLVLESYVDRKKIEETFRLGNSIDIKGIRDELPRAEQFPDSIVPIEMILSRIPGLIGFSLKRLEECISKNGLELCDLIFEEEVLPTANLGESIQDGNMLKDQPSVLKSGNTSKNKISLYNPSKLGKIIELFSLVGAFLLVFKMFNLVSDFLGIL